MSSALTGLCADEVHAGFEGFGDVFRVPNHLKRESESAYRLITDEEMAGVLRS